MHLKAFSIPVPIPFPKVSRTGAFCIEASQIEKDAFQPRNEEHDSHLHFPSICPLLLCGSISKLQCQ